MIGLDDAQVFGFQCSWHKVGIKASKVTSGWRTSWRMILTTHVFTYIYMYEYLHIIYIYIFYIIYVLYICIQIYVCIYIYIIYSICIYMAWTGITCDTPSHFQPTSVRLLGPWQCNVECVCGSMKPNSTRSGSRGSGVRCVGGKGGAGWWDFRHFRGRLSDSGRRFGPRLWFLWFLIFHEGIITVLTWNMNFVLGFTNHCKKMLRLLKKQTVPVFFLPKFWKPCWSLVEAFLLKPSSCCCRRRCCRRLSPSSSKTRISIPHGFDSRRTTTSPGSRIPRGCHAAFWSQHYTWCQEPQLWPLWKMMAI